jgi:replicative DNA helicase
MVDKRTDKADPGPLVQPLTKLSPCVRDAPRMAVVQDFSIVAKVFRWRKVQIKGNPPAVLSWKFPGIEVGRYLQRCRCPASPGERHVSAVSVGYHARRVRDAALLRRVIATAGAIVARAYEPVEDVAAFLDQAEREFFKLGQSRRRSRGPRQIGETLTGEWMASLERRYQAKNAVTGLATGFIDLDRLTCGLHPADLIVVAGRPSMGKTAYVLSIAENVARSDIGVLIFSLEMSYEQLQDRFMASGSGVELGKIRSGFLSDRDFPALAKQAGNLVDAKIWVDDTAAINVLELRAAARRLAANPMAKLGLVIVDYLQLMRGSTGSMKREQEVSEISRSLKALAKDLRLPVIALSQLNREVESRNPPKPRLADLRESGSIEQDADVVQFLYRENYYDPNSTRKNEADVIVAKQRQGPIGTETLTFIPHLVKFDNYERNTCSPAIGREV